MKTDTKNIGSSESGQAILESFLTMLVLLLVLFGLMQIFLLANAKLLTSYSAFRSLRSYIVGFDDYLIIRSARAAAIGASGKIIYPDNQEYLSPQQQFAAERFMIPDYLGGSRWLEYEYWRGGNEYDSTFYHASVSPPRTYLNYSTAGGGGAGMITQTVSFRDYPYSIVDMADKDRTWLPLGPSTDISSSAVMFNHAADYLSEE
ncbi:MAG TPA: hypothetical protein P5270_02780 [Victivallales bacterium]|nr:hypothetical protein [Victivallales bacterium]HRR28262.1 hypothetical protein [Victivallales bacterium]HRU01275.1 hypothetical protein [Victivallales bacterium]